MGKIFLTGATGFIGQATASKVKGGLRVVSRSNKSCQYSDTWTVDEISSNTRWTGAFEDVEVIIHLAGLAHSKAVSSNDYTEINTRGTLQLALQAAEAGVKRFVFVSSIGVNGWETIDEEFSCHSNVNPHNIYAQCKYDAEVGLQNIAEETGLEVVIVRPTLVYGVNAPGNFGRLTKLVNRSRLLPFGLTDNKRDFIAVQNLADLLITCAKHPDAGGHIFLASDGETVSIKEFTNAIAKGLGKKVYQLPIPVTLMRLAGKLVGKSDIIDQLYGNLEVDSSNVKDVLGWTPPLTMKQAMATLRDIGTK